MAFAVDKKDDVLVNRWNWWMPIAKFALVGLSEKPRRPNKLSQAELTMS